MLRHLRELIERQIERARLEGHLEGLPGEGKPLPNGTHDAMSNTAEAAGFRIMAQAGVLPEEIEIRKELEDARLRLAELPEGPERTQAMRAFSELELRYNIAREARRKFLKS